MCTIIPDRQPSAEAPRGLHAICEDARRGQCDHCSAMPGEPCAFSGTGPDGYHVARFTWARAHDLISVLDVGAVLWTVAATPFTTLTVIYDPGAADQDDAGPEDTMSAEARMVGEVRAVLAAFDWEYDDRQLALEAIDCIVGSGDEDQDAEPEHYTCSTCGALIGMFIGRQGWLHYRGEGTVANPVEIYDAGHEATFAAGQDGAS